MNNSAEFGRKWFGMLKAGQISRQELLSEIEKHSIDSNTCAVLCCFREDDRDMNLDIQRIHFKQSFQHDYKIYTEEPATIAIIAARFFAEWDSMVFLDDYFKCDLFKKMLLEELKIAWGEDYVEYCESRDAFAESMPFDRLQKIIEDNEI